MEATATRLARFMERHRLQQKDVAAGVGVSRISVGEWYHGRSVPSGTNLTRLVAYLRRFEPDIQNEDVLGFEAPEVLVVGEHDAAVTR